MTTTYDTEATNMTTYDRIAATVVAVALLLLAVLIVPRDAAPGVITCGTVVEDGESVPASCMTDAELDAALDRIYAERSGGRFTTEGR